MKRLPKVNRRVWIALELQARRRKRVRAAQAEAQAAPALPPSLLLDLVAYWKLDEDTGDIRVDATGHGLGLAEWEYFGDPSAPVGLMPGVIGGAAVFTDAANIGLKCDEAGGWESVDDFTVAGWVQFAAGGYDGQSVFMLDNCFWVGIRAYQEALQFGSWVDADPGYCYLQSDDGALTQGLWHHFAGVRQSGGLTLYLDGVAVATGAMTGPALVSLPVIRMGLGSGGYPLNGALDEFGLWQRALLPEEVVQLYAAGAGLAYEEF